ncbi:hypothetical protein [Novosphingobium sp. G106]|uniref:hypothetical protein n=1 Tax=Novosphingobium sp. G106 TaxID=2849500 RepID=UPI0035C83689
MEHLVLDHLARGEADLGHAVDAGLDVLVVRIAHALTGLDEEVDDFGERRVEQRRQLGARMDQRVEVELRGDEADAEVARTMRLVGALDHLAADEEGGGVGGCGLARRRVAQVGQRIHGIALQSGCCDSP